MKPGDTVQKGDQILLARAYLVAAWMDGADLRGADLRDARSPPHPL